MIRNIIIGFLILLIVLFIFIARKKADEAETQVDMAMENLKNAQEQGQSMKEKILVLETRMDLVQQQLETCQSGK